ncbi:hypothetical protein ONS96_000435 [Cadophora gregata f. sp. sojae]|nr:hypothetical protein ONS96_000435 [Cadophora gregata f. sp. sojae]
MSTRQSSIIIFLLEDVYVGDYERWGFSPSFQAKYGEPMEYYSDFHRLMTTSFDYKVSPRIKRLASLADQDTKPRFLWFCQMADDIARKEELPMLKRREMEAAWVWAAFELYEKDETADPTMLKKIIARRIHPRLKVEQYWQDKCAKLCWSSHEIAFLEDGCEEDPESERIVDGDDYVDLDMGPADKTVTGKQILTQLEGKMDDLEIAENS